MTTEGDELAAADEERRRAASGVEGREFLYLASSIGVEVEGPMVTALVEDGNIPGGVGGNSYRTAGAAFAGGTDPDFIVPGRHRHPEEIDLHPICADLRLRI